MDKDKFKKLFYCHENHGGITRRNFLGQMASASWAFSAMPGMLSLLSQKAYSQDIVCSATTTSGATIPALIFDLRGGANIAGSNVMVGGPGGQSDFLPSYETLGLPMSMHPSQPGQTNSEMGLMFHNDSGFLRGIQEFTAASTRANCDGALFCSESENDRDSNPHNPVYWLIKAGATGQLTNGAGNKNSISGGNSIVPMASIDPTLQPVSINRPEDAFSLINLGLMGDLFSSEKAQKILKAVEKMSEEKVKSFSSKALPEQIKVLVQCGYIQSQDMLSRFSQDALDPFGAGEQTGTIFQNSGDDRAVGTLTKLLLDGYLGVATFAKGGYDYHTGNRSVGEVRDLAAGRLMGKALEVAALKGKPLMIYVLTDGGVSSSATRDGALDNSTDGRGKLSWFGDSDQRSATFMMVYNPTAKPELRVPGRRQIGHYKPSQGLERSANLVSNNVVNLAKAIVANYLALQGREGQLASIVGDNPFGMNLEQYLIFNQVG